MPRPRAPGSAEPKKRSRTGCWPCKARKVKCDEERPQCQNCVKQGEPCDYSIRLNWGGRSKRSQDESVISFNATDPPTTPAASSNVKPIRSRSESSNSQSNAHAQSGTLQPSQYWPLPTPASMTTIPLDSPQQPQLPSFAQFSSHSTTGWMQTDSARQKSTESYTPAAHAEPSLSGDGALTNRPDLVLPPLSRPDFSWSSQHASKRLKLSPLDPTQTLNDRTFARPMLPEGTVSPGHFDHPSPASTHYTSQSLNGFLGTPMTPGSSVQSEDAPKTNPRNLGLSVHDATRVRRLSVNSLLSGPPGDDGTSSYARPGQYRKVVDDGFVAYGYDYGQPDFDIPRNDDSNAIAPQSPNSTRTARTDTASTAPSIDDKATRPQAFERGGYYANPVQIKIPPHLEPLPHYVAENPMNLLYFHHFLNHTARILVPLDCPDNPLRRILPKSKCFTNCPVLSH